VTEHPRGRPDAQHLDVVDAVPTGEQAMHHRQDLAARPGGTGPFAEVDQLVGGLLDPQPVGQGGGQQQPGVGDQALVIERRIDLVQHDVGGSHRKGASGSRGMAGFAAAILPGQEALFTIQPASTDHPIGGFRLSMKRGGTSTVDRRG
jgi:hypothetical protein